MFVKNTGEKIINIGPQVVMPGDTVEIAEMYADTPATKIFMQFGYLTEVAGMPEQAEKKVEEAEEPADKPTEEAEKPAEEEEKSAEEPKPVKKKKAADKAE